MGGNTGQYFLRWVGWDSWITSGDMVAALKHAGLDIADNPTSKRDIAEIQRQMNAFRRESGLPYAHISKILAYSSGDNHDAATIKARTGGE